MVQPPVGKLLIAVGEWLYGLTSFGWRTASAFFGTLAILVMCRVTRRLTRSTLLGCVAGLLFSLDGLEFVLSRTGILDIFLMFFVLASFGCLVVDRDVSRARLAEAMVLEPSDESGPQLGIRKWRVAAGVLVGLAGGTKQDAVWYIFAFVGLCIAWDMGARRTVGLRSYVRGALVRDGKWLPLTFGVIPLVTYIATWSGWFATSTGYDRNYAQLNGVNIPIISPLYSLFEYHKEMYQFMSTLSPRHPYESQPWDWLVITRPVAFFWQSYTNAAGTQPGQGRDDRPVGAGGARDRQPRHLVGVDPRAAVLPLLVAHPAGLAGRRRRAVLPGRLGDLAAVARADQVLLLRARVRAVHHHLHRALPRPDHRPGHRRACGAGRSGGSGRRLRTCCAAGVLVLLPDPRGSRSFRTRTGCPTCGTAAGSNRRDLTRRKRAVSAA